jgi:transmembrane sensor
VKKLHDKITAVPEWDKSAKEIWDERFAALTDDDTESIDSNTAENDDTASCDAVPAEGAKIISIRRKIMYAVSAAAVVMILFSITALSYKKDVSAESGKTRVMNLPDGSLAILSSGTEASYRPLLWFLSPKVAMTGEAYFSGHHAKGFTVTTEQGDISVLGTTFNVSDYNDELNVACIEGKINVKSGPSSVILTSKMRTKAKRGKFETDYISNIETVVGWTEGIFSFDNQPLRDVLENVERFYGIKIAAPTSIDSLRYTGKFTRDKKPEEILSIISEPYGITLRIVK